jgi:hypothetical protein
MPDYTDGKSLPPSVTRSHADTERQRNTAPGSAVPTSPVRVLVAASVRGSYLGHEHDELRATSLR